MCTGWVLIHPFPPLRRKLTSAGGRTGQDRVEERRKEHLSVMKLRVEETVSIEINLKFIFRFQKARNIRE